MTGATSELSPADSDGVPVLLTWSNGSPDLEIREHDGGPDLTPVVGEAARLARDLLGLAPDARIGARTFECHPDDLRLLDGAARRFMDENGYARAFAHDADSHFVVNARFREVQSMPAMAIDPVSMAILVSQVRVQQTLETMQVQLQGIQGSLDHLIRMGVIERESAALADVEAVADVWVRLRDSGMVSLTDWEQIAALGTALRRHHRIVVGALDEAAAHLRFTNVREAKQSVSKVTPEYVRSLVDMEELVRRALLQHLHVSLVVRETRGEETAGLADQARLKMARYSETAEERYRAIRALHPDVSRPSVLGAFFKKGLIARENDIRAVEEAKQNLSLVQARVPAKALPAPRPVRRLHYQS